MELIPLEEITYEARKIAVDWVENFKPMGFDIQQKHKLASDIMNYAKLVQEQNKELERIEHQKHNEIKWNRLKGEFCGTLIGICAWDIPAELKLKLESKIKELEN